VQKDGAAIADARPLQTSGQVQLLLAAEKRDLSHLLEVEPKCPVRGVADVFIFGRTGFANLGGAGFGILLGRERVALALEHIVGETPVARSAAATAARRLRERLLAPDPFLTDS